MAYEMKKAIVALLLGLSVIGCGNCKGSSEDADAFVRDPANQECQVDEDCVVQSVTCTKMETQYCGQVELSAEAAASDEWRNISDGLDACGESCAVCLAALSPGCEDGVCASY